MVKANGLRSRPYDRCIAMLIVFCLISFTFTGCSGSKTVIRDDEGIGHLSDNPDINIVTYPDSSMNVHSQSRRNIGIPGIVAAGLAGGAVGMIIAFGIGEAIFIPLDKKDALNLTNTYSLEDPVHALKDQFVSSLNGEYKFHKISESLNVETGDSVKDLKARFRQGMVLDFNSIQWGFIAHPFSLTKYDFIYSAQARLVSLDGSKIVWQGLCSYNSYRENTLEPTMEQLTANNGELLKRTLKESANKCGERLIKEFFHEQIAIKSPQF